MPETRVVVVGAGVAGLSCAAELAHAGMQVTLCESAPSVGGKMRTLHVDGAAIDAGPTVMTMRWVFDALFTRCGQRLGDAVTLQPLPVLARHFWGDGSTLDLFADRRASEDAVGRFAGAAEARRFAAFCRQAAQVYRALEAPYIRAAAPSMAQLTQSMGWQGLASLTRIGPMRSLMSSLQRQLHHPKLQQLFGRYATYCGSSPWQAPATLMLIAEVEMQGVWAVQGGMAALAEALAALATSQGVELRCATAVQRIELTGGRVSGVRLQDGSHLEADAVVFNGDPNALRQGLLGEPARAAVERTPPPRSLSAVTWAVHTATAGVALDRHNVFFDDDYASEFEAIFGTGTLPPKPTVYLCAQDRGVGKDPAPGQAERALCLVNAPARGDWPGWQEEDWQTCEDHTMKLLQRCGLRWQPQPHQMQRCTPVTFHQRFAASGGALYGQATHGWMAAFSRPGASSPIAGLFLAGGSVHPGPGVPMAALSGRQAAAALMASPALTKRCHPVATSGGTLTH
jgi:1-hydroxycarotenoid 3,4-desaturase